MSCSKPEHIYDLGRDISEELESSGIFKSDKKNSNPPAKLHLMCYARKAMESYQTATG